MAQVRREGEHPEERAQDILAFRDPCDRLDMERIDEVDEAERPHAPIGGKGQGGEQGTDDEIVRARTRWRTHEPSVLLEPEHYTTPASSVAPARCDAADRGVAPRAACFVLLQSGGDLLREVLLPRGLRQAESLPCRLDRLGEPARLRVGRR